MKSNTVKTLYFLLAFIFVSATLIPSVLADFSEEFQTDGIIGANQGGAYVAGADWTVTHGLANTALFTGGTGLVRIAYSHGTSVGPNDGTPHLLVRNDTLGEGTYEARFVDYRPKLMFGYQNASNYYFVVCNRQFYTGVGTVGIVFGHRVNNADTFLAGVDTIGSTEEAVDDIEAITVEWDPSVDTVQVSVVWTDVTGTTNKFNGIAFGASDENVFEEGKCGVGNALDTLNATEIDYIRFTEPPPPDGMVISVK